MNFKKNISLDQDNLVSVERKGMNSHIVAELIKRRKNVTQTWGTSNQVIAIMYTWPWVDLMNNIKYYHL